MNSISRVFVYGSTCWAAIVLGGCQGDAPSTGSTVETPGPQCIGDPDDGQVQCLGGQVWDCTTLANQNKRCERSFGAPTGDAGWRCRQQGTTLTCEKAQPDAVGGSEWDCRDQDGKRVCTSSPLAGGGGSAGTENGDSESGGGGSTADGPAGAVPSTDDGTPDGGGRWVCVSDDVKTVCTSTDEGNQPPGGSGTWDCTVTAEDYRVICDETSPGTPGAGSADQGSPGSPGGTTPGPFSPSSPITGAGAQTCFCPAKPDGISDKLDGPLVTVFAREETYKGETAIYARATFSRQFNNNTYGVNSASCWGAKKQHTFRQLDKSDAATLFFHTCGGDKVLGPRVDYISPSPDVASGYRSLCIDGGDGQMELGDADQVLGCHTSLDENFNTHGYVLTEDSPPTDDSFTPVAPYEQWDYLVWYGVWVRKSAFGGAGACQVTLEYVHASPACGLPDTIDVVPCPCI